ncbi:MAG: M23 family metallopeptidase [Pseudomonadota bacterium]
MKVICQHCQSPFDVPVKSLGQIDYDGCKNVFRIAYRVRTPCPTCKTILQVTPNGKSEAIGVPLTVQSQETTEKQPPRSKTGHTQRTNASHGKSRRAAVNAHVLTKVKPFRFADHARNRPKPAHVSVRPRRRGLLPLLKFIFGLMIVTGTAATIVLTVYAMRSNAGGKLLNRAILKAAPAFEKRAANHPAELPADPQGGPGPDILEESIEDPPPVWVKSEPQSKEQALRLPSRNRLTSQYGPRIDPFAEGIEYHRGIDFRAEYRSEVKAALDGKVIRAGDWGSYGNIVIVEHPDGYQSRYAHLEKVLVKVGKRVKQGDLLGLAGSTGHSTGTHIHFELIKDGKRVDPIRAKLIAGRW